MSTRMISRMREKKAGAVADPIIDPISRAAVAAHRPQAMPRFQLVHSRAHCCPMRTGTTSLGTLSSDMTACEAACEAKHNCSFISYYPRLRRCAFCSACELAFQHQYSSFARLKFDTVSDLLERVLDASNYSLAVYRRHMRIVTEKPPLRLIMLHLLPERALHQLRGMALCAARPNQPPDVLARRACRLPLRPSRLRQRVRAMPTRHIGFAALTHSWCGVAVLPFEPCPLTGRWQSSFPWRPFFFSIDLFANPLNALWVGREEADLGLPVPTDGMVEVTHCAERRWRRGAASPPGRGASGWQFGPMWLFAAAGSGLSVSVGRTLATSHEDAVKLLSLVFPSKLECALCKPGCEWGRRVRDGHGFSQGATNGSGRATPSRPRSRHLPEDLAVQDSASRSTASKAVAEEACVRITEYPLLIEPSEGAFGSYRGMLRRGRRVRCWSGAMLQSHIDSIQACFSPRQRL